MTQDSQSGFQQIIEPTRGWRPAILWKELYNYRDLLWLLVWRDFTARYRQTVLGPVWYIVQPLMTTAVFIVIFSRVAHIPTNGVPSSLFYLCGLLGWGYFSQNFQSTAGTLVNNSGMFGKVYFPRLIVPLSAVVSNSLTALVQLGIFFVVYGAEKMSVRAGSFGITGEAILLPFIFLHLALVSFGAGLWFTALTAKFRDFGVIAGFLVQLWMYGSPVIYPLTRVPQRWHIVAALNPVTYPLEEMRMMLLGAGTPSLHLAVVSITVTLFVLLGGLILFQRSERDFIDVI